MSGLHQSEIQRLMGSYRLTIRKPTEEELDASQYIFSRFCIFFSLLNQHLSF